MFFATLRMNENVNSYSLRILLLLRRMNKSHMRHEPKKQNTYEWDTCMREGVRDETHGWECEFEKKSLSSLNTLVIFTSHKTREREIRHMNENVNVNANVKRSLSARHMLETLPSLENACVREIRHMNENAKKMWLLLVFTWEFKHMSENVNEREVGVTNSFIVCDSYVSHLIHRSWLICLSLMCLFVRDSDFSWERSRSHERKETSMSDIWVTNDGWEWEKSRSHERKDTSMREVWVTNKKTH